MQNNKINNEVLNLSITARILVNAEALNMAESVGNYTRHRKAPIVVPTKDGYSIIYVPAVSGESLAHAYQSILTQIAVNRNLPVTLMDKQGYFMKFSSNDIIRDYYKEEIIRALKIDKNKIKEAIKNLNTKDITEIERLIIEGAIEEQNEIKDDLKKLNKKNITEKEIKTFIIEGAIKEQIEKEAYKNKIEEAIKKLDEIKIDKNKIKEAIKNLNTKDITEIERLIIEGAIKVLSEKDKGEIERLFLLFSVVADVGGFLYTDGSVKKTSAIRFGYLIPATDALYTRGASIVPQLHVRYTPMAKRGEQAIFYVESGSALYTLTAQLLLSDIGRITMDPNLSDDELNKQRGSRIEAAVDALMFLVDGMLFGAKRSRYLPQWDMRSLLVGVSSGPVEFNVTPGLSKDYIKRSYDRAITLSKALNGSLNGSMKIDLFAFNGEKGYLEEPQRAEESSSVSYSEVSSSAEAFSKAKEVIESFFGSSKKG
jgi:CRISPR-associated protein Csa2